MSFRPHIQGYPAIEDALLVVEYELIVKRQLRLLWGTRMPYQAEDASTVTE